jgi:tetratricopeptide (TPR) repeat protein
MESFAGNLQEALGHYERCLTVAREFCRQKPEDSVRKQLLATNYAGLGFAQLNNLEADKAVESFRAGLQVLGAKPNGLEDHDRTLNVPYGRMGNALNETGSNTEATPRFQKAIAIAEDLARKSPSTSARRSVYAWYCNFVGFLAGRETLNTGQRQQAQIYARKALAIAEELAASDTTNVQARHDLAYAYMKVGDSLGPGRLPETIAWYRKAIALTKELRSL